jgi:hypothetical protein
MGPTPYVLVYVTGHMLSAPSVLGGGGGIRSLRVSPDIWGQLPFWGLRVVPPPLLSGSDLYVIFYVFLSYKLFAHSGRQTIYVLV